MAPTRACRDGTRDAIAHQAPATTHAQLGPSPRVPTRHSVRSLGSKLSQSTEEELTGQALTIVVHVAQLRLDARGRPTAAGCTSASQKSEVSALSHRCHCWHSHQRVPTVSNTKVKYHCPFCKFLFPSLTSCLCLCLHSVSLFLLSLVCCLWFAFHVLDRFL